MTSSYEVQLALVTSLKAPDGDDDRIVRWCTAEPGSLGVARTPKGEIEIFLEGTRLEPRYPRVRKAIEYQQWFREDGKELIANRLLLPSAGHFEQVAAFLCTELLRTGVTDDLAAAFAKTEPLIDLAIRDLQLSDEALLGLYGEMLVLRSLIARASDLSTSAVLLESWKGYRETARDFQLGVVGVEVKTTASASSSHRFSGIHQLEPGHGVDGADENALLVLSIGVERASLYDQDNTTSLPEILEDILEKIASATGRADSPLAEELLSHVLEYGSPASLGYDHRTTATNPRFARRFRTRFARGYKIEDPPIHLLTTDDLHERPFIDSGSLSLRVNFPDEVNGGENPVIGLEPIIEHIAYECGLVLTRQSAETRER